MGGFFDLECEPNGMDHFVKTKRVAKQITQEKPGQKNFCGVPSITKEQTTNRWIAEKELEQKSENQTVLDHCHYTGRFLGWAHALCNLKRRAKNFTTLFAHILAIYDSHHVIFALQGLNEKNRFSIVPTTDERFISLQIGIQISTTQTKKVSGEANLNTFDY